MKEKDNEYYRKETHVHPDAITAVETFFKDENTVSSRVIHTADGKQFSTRAKQVYDPALMDGLIAIRGEDQ